MSFPDSVQPFEVWRMPPGACRAKVNPPVPEEDPKPWSPCGDPNHWIYGEPCPCTGENK
jgi:hypothetical protein